MSRVELEEASRRLQLTFVAMEGLTALLRAMLAVTAATRIAAAAAARAQGFAARCEPSPSPPSSCAALSSLSSRGGSSPGELPRLLSEEPTPPRSNAPQPMPQRTAGAAHGQRALALMSLSLLEQLERSDRETLEARAMLEFATCIEGPAARVLAARAVTALSTVNRKQDALLRRAAAAATGRREDDESLALAASLVRELAEGVMPALRAQAAEGAATMPPLAGGAARRPPVAVLSECVAALVEELRELRGTHH